MEQHALVGVGYLERVAHLGCGPTKKVTHGDDFALVGRESIDRPPDRLHRFGVECTLFGVSPRMRRPFPLAARAPGQAVEASWIDRGLVVEGGSRRERDR